MVAVVMTMTPEETLQATHAALIELHNAGELVCSPRWYAPNGGFENFRTDMGAPAPDHVLAFFAAPNPPYNDGSWNARTTAWAHVDNCCGLEHGRTYDQRRFRKLKVHGLVDPRRSLRKFICPETRALIN